MWTQRNENVLLKIPGIETKLSKSESKLTKSAFSSYNIYQETNFTSANDRRVEASHKVDICLQPVLSPTLPFPPIPHVPLGGTSFNPLLLVHRPHQMTLTLTSYASRAYIKGRIISLQSVLASVKQSSVSSCGILGMGKPDSEDNLRGLARLTQRGGHGLCKSRLVHSSE